MIGHIAASSLLARHSALFWQARQGQLVDRTFVTHGGQECSVGATLRIIERELRDRCTGVVWEHEQVWLDLQSIVVQREEWEAEEATGV